MYTKRYKVCDKEIEHVFNEKDLGVIIDSELLFEEHISTKVRVANAIVRRSFTHLDCKSFTKIYIAFVRHHLEYAQSVWASHYRKHINMLENVQIRASKLVDGLWNMDYPERLKRLNIPTLVYRRLKGLKFISISIHTIKKSSQHHSSHGSAPPGNTIFRSLIERQRMGYEEFNRNSF